MPWLWVVVLLGLLVMVGMMMILVLSRWLRRLASQRGPGLRPPEREQDATDAWTESARRVDVDLDPDDDEDDEEDKEGRPGA